MTHLAASTYPTSNQKPTTPTSHTVNNSVLSLFYQDTRAQPSILADHRIVLAPCRWSLLGIVPAGRDIPSTPTKVLTKVFPIHNKRLAVLQTKDHPGPPGLAIVPP